VKELTTTRLSLAARVVAADDESITNTDTVESAAIDAMLETRFTELDAVAVQLDMSALMTDMASTGTDSALPMSLLQVRSNYVDAVRPYAPVLNDTPWAAPNPTNMLLAHNFSKPDVISSAVVLDAAATASTLTGVCGAGSTDSDNRASFYVPLGPTPDVLMPQPIALTPKVYTLRCHRGSISALNATCNGRIHPLFCNGTLQGPIEFTCKEFIEVRTTCQEQLFTGLGEP